MQVMFNVPNIYIFIAQSFIAILLSWIAWINTKTKLAQYKINKDQHTINRLTLERLDNMSEFISAQINLNQGFNDLHGSVERRLAMMTKIMELNLVIKDTEGLAHKLEGKGEPN